MRALNDASDGMTRQTLDERRRRRRMMGEADEAMGWERERERESGGAVRAGS